MPVGHLDHFTLSVPPRALGAVRAFYVSVLGLIDGPRPDFDFPGHWLYTDAGTGPGARAVVHLAGLARDVDTEVGDTGRLDHIALAATDLAGTRARLRDLAVPWREAPVPGRPLHQVFLADPTGLRIELTFDAAEAR